MIYTHFIGIDVSKDTLDFAILEGKMIIKKGVVGNNQEGVMALLKEVKQNAGRKLGGK